MANEQSINRARNLLEIYADWQDDPFDDDREGHIAGLLADLMHFCQAESIDFSARLRMAEIHFNEEQDEEN